MIVLTAFGHWYQKRTCEAPFEARAHPPSHAVPWSSVKGDVRPDRAAVLEIHLPGSFTSYYIFYLIEKFGLSTKDAQIYQFVFFAAVAAGTVAGGPIGDRLGRKLVIWVSILGVLPFTLLLPHVGLGDGALSVVIGFVIASAFPAILVYGQELMPGRVGMVSGLFFGFIFGIGGIGGGPWALADWQASGSCSNSAPSPRAWDPHGVSAEPHRAQDGLEWADCVWVDTGGL